MFNTAASRFFQVHQTGESLIEWRQWHDLYSSDGSVLLSDDQRPLVRAVRGESVDEYEVMVREEDMSDRILSCNIRPLLDAQRQPLGGLAVFTDVTARKAAQRQRQRQEQVLELIASGALLGEVLDAVVGLVEVQASGGHHSR